MKLALFLSIVLVSSAAADPPSVPAEAELLHQFVEAGTLSNLRWPNFTDHQIDARKFYRERQYSLAWVRDHAPTPQSQALIAAFVDAGAKGLDPEDYDGSRWAARLARLRPAIAAPSEDEVVRFDLAVTISAMRYVSDLHIGKVNPQVFCFGLNTGPKECDVATLLSRRAVTASDVTAVLAELEPPFAAYRRTKTALQTYLRLAKEDDGELLPATKKPVEHGQVYAGVPRLDRLLRRIGDLPAGSAAPAGDQVYEGPLVEAVKHFQTRHGLEPDGRIGSATLKQLNTPLSYRVRQLQLVLERWRWVPDAFARPPVVVNIPEFRLYAFNNRYEPELQMKVVVGGAYRRQTPVFSNSMTHLIFRPYWNVPLSIQRNELVPNIQKDEDYLEKNDYEVVDNRGAAVASGTVTPKLIAQLRSGQLAIRQIPGPKNALGYIKFLFPNEYNVYLHGTPAKALFSKTRRDFSHGCIRVEKPEELALWVLKDKPGWDLDRIRAAENGIKPLQVNLDKPIPVLIVYATAVARADGEVFFYDDIYGHDAALDELLAKGYPYSDWKPTSGECVRRPRE